MRSTARTYDQIRQHESRYEYDGVGIDGCCHCSCAFAGGVRRILTSICAVL
jgi:hypothetical protein